MFNQNLPSRSFVLRLGSWCHIQTYSSFLFLSYFYSIPILMTWYDQLTHQSTTHLHPSCDSYLVLLSACIDQSTLDSHWQPHSQSCWSLPPSHTNHTFDSSRHSSNIKSQLTKCRWSIVRYHINLSYHQITPANRGKNRNNNTNSQQHGFVHPLARMQKSHLTCRTPSNHSPNWPLAAVQVSIHVYLRGPCSLLSCETLPTTPTNLVLHPTCSPRLLLRAWGCGFGFFIWSVMIH